MILKGKPLSADGKIYLTAESENTNLEKDYEKGLCKSEQFFIYRINGESKRNIGRTWLAPMPGCCGVVVSFGTYLEEISRNSGLSEPFRDLKKDLAKSLGYTLVIATTQMNNIPAVGNMIKSKYTIVKTFTNKRTNNLIGFGIKDLS